MKTMTFVDGDNLYTIKESGEIVSKVASDYYHKPTHDRWSLPVIDALIKHQRIIKASPCEKAPRFSMWKATAWNFNFK